MNSLVICEENKSMIRRFDEVLCDKASKFSIVKVYKGKEGFMVYSVDIEVFLEKEKFKNFRQEYENGWKQLNGKINNLRGDMEQLHIKLSGELTGLILWFTI